MYIDIYTYIYVCGYMSTGPYSALLPVSRPLRAQTAGCIRPARGSFEKPAEAAVIAISIKMSLWMVVKIMVFFGVLRLIRHLVFRGPQKRTIVLTTTVINPGSYEP